MITAVGSVCVFVKDQERAKSFYMQQLGMELQHDGPMPNDTDARWISVAPPGSKTEIVLYKRGDPFWAHYEATVGAVQSITLRTDDLSATVSTLRDRGVKILQEPEDHEWGSFAMIEDSEGNTIILVTESN